MNKRYEIHYPHSAYTWPTEARAERVSFDESYMHIHLRDGRILLVPLWWIPSLANAPAAAREQVIIGRDGHTLHWHPEDGSINEDLVIASFMRYDEPNL